VRLSRSVKRLAPDMLAKVDAWRAEHGVTHAPAVRYMIADFVQRLERRRR